MLRQRGSRPDPDRAGDEGRRRPERVRGASARHRRHCPGVECLEGRQLLSAITEFPLRKPLPHTSSSSPGDLTVGPDGNLWFTETSFGSTGIVTGSAIGRITPAGAFTEFPLPAGHGSPGDLTVGPDGNLWFIEYFPREYPSSPPPPFGKIGRITPSGAITEFPLPDNGSSGDLTVGPDGNLWFPDSTGIGRITPAGALTEFPLPAYDSDPGDLTVGPDGNLWFPMESAVGPAIYRITPSGALTEFPLPAGDSGPGDLTVGPDGNLWFTDVLFSSSSSSSGLRGTTQLGAITIGRITPSGTLTDFPAAFSSTAGPSLTVGPDGNLWFTDIWAAAIGRITPSGAFTEFQFPAGDGFPGDLMTVGPDGNLWFPTSGAIGRIDPTPPRVTKVVAVAHPGKAITSIVLRFDSALDPASAREGRYYGLAAGVDSGQTIVYGKAERIARVSYDRAARAVRLKLAAPQKGPVQVTVRAGLAAADGMSSFSDFTAVVT
jgi:streptogramin lyase